MDLDASGPFCRKRSARNSKRSIRTVPFFRSRIDMARYRFGRGEYQYFKNPLSSVDAQLRETPYRHLRKTTFRQDCRYPESLGASLKICDANAQHGRRCSCFVIVLGMLIVCVRMYMVLLCSLLSDHRLEQREDEFSGGELLPLDRVPELNRSGTLCL
jgi:uncharacterized protein